MKDPKDIICFIGTVTPPPSLEQDDLAESEGSEDQNTESPT